ncbi:hypothetical protein EJ02DRAFT_135986 [Clathrospora elynae]|uniref:Uncharacterized protein n=1 Tax=Clathrospora elynae TaxID=706981 RepID=A0A6A5S542_9PLEO|nr:hypothetical protein EJ02DRAFT_135986 [Clathrospora elynae]
MDALARPVESAVLLVASHSAVLFAIHLGAIAGEMTDLLATEAGLADKTAPRSSAVAIYVA